MIFTRIKKLNVDRSHLGTILPMSHPIPGVLFLLTTCHHMSQCVTNQGPVQTDFGLTSLNLFAWPPRLWLRLRFAPRSKPRTEDGGRRQKVEDRSHLIEQLVALHTTCQLCPDKRIFFVLPNIFDLYFLYELYFIYCFNFRHKCICI